MKTTKPCSTISYNSTAYLKERLDELVTKRAISFYAFIRHFKEADETKDHIHLILFPNGQLQTDMLYEYLQELDIRHIDKPLGVMPWRSSKWSDWYLYSSHDTAYLLSKGQTRAHHYEEIDFVTSSTDYLHELVTTIDRSKYAKTQDFVSSVLNGATLDDMLVRGQIPAPQFLQWSAMYSYLTQGVKYRGIGETHSPKQEEPLKVDSNTGEVIND